MLFQASCVVFGHYLGWKPIHQFTPTLHLAELLIGAQMHGG
jgi:hypothetical protein